MLRISHPSFVCNAVIVQILCYHVLLFNLTTMSNPSLYSIFTRAGSVCSHFGAVKHPVTATGEMDREGKGREEEEKKEEKEEEEEEEEEEGSTLISGGSSGGSAVAVATDMCHL